MVVRGTAPVVRYTFVGFDRGGGETSDCGSRQVVATFHIAWSVVVDVATVESDSRQARKP